jgi:hypothetical protein
MFTAIAVEMRLGSTSPSSQSPFMVSRVAQTKIHPRRSALRHAACSSPNTLALRAISSAEAGKKLDKKG